MALAAVRGDLSTSGLSIALCDLQATVKDYAIRAATVPDTVADEILAGGGV